MLNLELIENIELMNIDDRNIYIKAIAKYLIKNKGLLLGHTRDFRLQNSVKYLNDMKGSQNYENYYEL